MLNANGPGFAGLYAGDVVRFRVPAGISLRGQEWKERTGAVIPALVFPGHVVCRVPYGVLGATVDVSNFVRLVRRGKRHIAADKARALFANMAPALDSDACVCDPPADCSECPR